MYNWIIGVCCTESDGVFIYRIYGSREQVKEKLLELVKQDQESNLESWDYGTETVEDIEERGLNELYAYGCYADYHIDYSAVLYATVEHL